MIYSIFNIIFLNGHKNSPGWIRIRYLGLRIHGSAAPGIRKKYFRILSTVEKHKCLSAARLSLSVLSWLSPLAHEEALDRLSPSNSSSKFGSGSPPSSGDSLWQCERPWNYHFLILENLNFMKLKQIIIRKSSSKFFFSAANFFFCQSLYFDE